MNKYGIIIRLYNSGITDIKELAKQVELSEGTLKNYILKAKKEGRIEAQGQVSTYEKVINLYKSGIINNKDIAKKLAISSETVRKYLIEAEKEEEIEKPKRKQSKRDTAKKINLVKKLLIDKCPMDIAKELRIEPYKVYDIIDSMSEDEKSSIIHKGLKNREYIYDRISELKLEGLGLRDALIEIESTERQVTNLFELADVYYILGARNACQRVINRIADNTKNSSTKDLAINKREKYKKEFLALDIRKSRRKDKNSDGTQISYESLCKKYNVRSNFVEQVLGSEDRDK